MSAAEADKLIEELKRKHAESEEELREMAKKLAQLRMLFEDTYPDSHRNPC